jgi:tetratricopeptide (TPR) repeat protein
MAALGEVALPDGFWERPETDRTLARRDIAALLTLILEETGLSQRALGVVTGFSQTQMSLYITRSRRPHLENIAKLADALAMPCGARQRLGLSPAVPGQAPPAEVKIYRILALAEYIGRTGDTSQLDAWQLLAASGTSADPWAQLSDLIEEPGPRATSAAEYLANVTRGFYLVIGRLPAKVVVRALTRHVQDVGRLLGDTADPAKRRELKVIAGEASYLAACCSVDLTDYAAAMRQLETMAKAASEAGDLPLAAMALDGQSHFQAAKGEHIRALHLVEQARESVSPEASPGTAVYLWLRTAEQHMYCRQRDQAAAAWAHAEALYPDVDLTTDRYWVRLWLSRDCFDSVRALLYAYTGRPDEARDTAERVAGRIARPEGKTDAIVLSNVALALTQIRQFKQAASAGTGALTAMRAAETTTCVGRLGCAAATLRKHAADVPQVQAFLRDFEATAFDMIAANTAS